MEKRSLLESSFEKQKKQGFKKGSASKEIAHSFSQDDPSFEIPLRPQSLEDFVGQEELKERLLVLIGAAQKRKEPLSHLLFSGPPGLGKTTLSHIIAKAMNASIVVTSGPLLERASDLAGILTNLQEGDILFIDEIHRMNRTLEEYLYPAIEDFSLDLMIDSGPAARSVQVKLNRFTLIGATTRMGLISSPLRSRFAFSTRIDYYPPHVLAQIVERTAKLIGLSMEKEASLEVASRARGTPRIANNLLKWVRDWVQMKNYQSASKEMVKKALEMLSIDEKGCDEMDVRLLSILIDHYEGGPVGLNTLAVALGEEKQTIEKVYEPFLINLGFLKRTPRGRMATSLAYNHIKNVRKL